jgi:hypothetical protein
MSTKRLYQPGEMVRSFTGQWGMVMAPEVLSVVRDHFREAKRPGCFFAPGCCDRPDYVTQVPVFFDDGTFDVMRSMNLRREPDPPGEVRAAILDLMDSQDDGQ